jgi:lipopolysaccharide biosynthesis regulator YciM
MITIGEKAYPLFDIVAHYLLKYPEKVSKNSAKVAVAEATRAKITHRQSQSSRGISTYGDVEKANSDYVAFKLGQAMACTDGTNTPDMDAKSWFGKRKTIHPYTDVEQQMFIKAAKVVGADVEDINHGDMRSLELDSTNKVSPVAKPKKNKYGV